MKNVWLSIYDGNPDNNFKYNFKMLLNNENDFTNVENKIIKRAKKIRRKLKYYSIKIKKNGRYLVRFKDNIETIFDDDSFLHAIDGSINPHIDLTIEDVSEFDKLCESSDELEEN
jgi:hypothetical protein